MRPCYFLFGEETYLAEEFIREIKTELISPEDQDYNIEKFNLENDSWMEILDLARTVPFFFSSRRIIVVNIPMSKAARLSPNQEKILREYLSAPSSHTIMVIILAGRVRKSARILKIFSSFPSSAVSMMELKPLKTKALFIWIDKELLSLGKGATSDAKARLVELIGNDLARIHHEIEKIAAYVGEKKVIERDDVNSVSGWIKSFYEWEVGDSLEKADYEKGLLVLDSLFRESVRPEYILGLVAKFFRDIFLAKLWLKEQEMDKKAIFATLKPQIKERFGNFYTTKFREFFLLVDKFPMKVLKHLLAELEQIDLKIKTSDLSAQTMLEGFLFDYCQFRRKKKVI